MQTLPGMADQFCFYELRGIRLIVESYSKALFSLCVLHFVFSPVATIGNVLAIRALWKASSLPANLRKLLLSLAFSDLFVGFFVHMKLAVVFKLALSENYNLDILCPFTLTLCYLVLYLLGTASFLNVSAIAVDRLLAVSLHLRYAELVTTKRVVRALATIWLGSCVVASVMVANLNFFVSIIIYSLGFMLMTVACYRVYMVTRYHQNQIRIQLQQQNVQAATVLLRERKSSLNVLHIYIAFVVTYLPRFFSVLIRKLNPSNDSAWVACYITMFLVLINSSINPLIYCWRYQEVRKVIKKTCKKTFCL